MPNIPLLISVLIATAAGALVMATTVTRITRPGERKVDHYVPALASFVWLPVIAFALRNHTPTVVATLVVALLSLALTVLWSRGASGEGGMFLIVLIPVQQISCAIPLVVRGIYEVFK